MSIINVNEIGPISVGSTLTLSSGSTLRLPTGSRIVGTDTGSFHAPGSIVQTVFLRTDTLTSYASNNSGDGTTVSALGITITPKSATNRLICQWMVNGEVHNDTVFLIHRDSALITTAGEEGRNSVSNSRWVGYVAGVYDGNDNSSTPCNWTLTYSQIAGSTTARTYAPATRSSSSGNQTFFLNRVVSGAGQDSYENMVSTAIIYEVAV